MVKRIDPLTGAMKTFKEAVKANVTGEREFRKEALNWVSEDKKITVDTCMAFDTQEWETGIEVSEGNWVIVEQYESKEKAVKGHAKWVELIKKNPKRDLKDIDVWGIEELKKKKGD